MPYERVIFYHYWSSFWVVMLTMALVDWTLGDGVSMGCRWTLTLIGVVMHDHKRVGGEVLYILALRMHWELASGRALGTYCEYPFCSRFCFAGFFIHRQRGRIGVVLFAIPRPTTRPGWAETRMMGVWESEEEGIWEIDYRLIGDWLRWRLYTVTGIMGIKGQHCIYACSPRIWCDVHVLERELWMKIDTE